MRSRLALLLLTATLLPACDADPLDLDVLLPTGEHIEVGAKVFMDNGRVFEGVAGIYLQRVMEFQDEARVRIDLFSDWKPDAGTVHGTYEIEGDELTITVTSSTSAFYEVGEVIYYDDVETGTLNVRFDTTNETFLGPGFLLRQRNQPDLNDLDGDGDRLEDLVIETYFLLIDE